MKFIFEFKSLNRIEYGGITSEKALVSFYRTRYFVPMLFNWRSMIKNLFNSFRQHFRERRYMQIENLIHVNDVDGFILDLGGGPASFFSAKFPRPERVVLLEIDHKEAYLAKQRQPEILVVIADGEQMPFSDNSIAMIVSNSVIEHVHSPERLASEIQRASKQYFVQTPNGDFPLETHSFVAIPFYNFIGWERIQEFACKLFGADYEYVKSVRYLSEQQLNNLFPRASLVYEKFLGLKKSFYIYYSRVD